VLSNGKRCPNEALPGSRYCGLPAHQALALQDTEDVEPVVAESEPRLEAQADAAPPEAESIGPESVAAVPEEAVPLQSAAPADVAATQGPPAEAIAETEGEVDLDVAQPELAELDQVPAGVPVEQTGGDKDREEGPPAA